jgi:hypothetical protein
VEGTTVAEESPVTAEAVAVVDESEDFVELWVDCGGAAGD